MSLTQGPCIHSVGADERSHTPSPQFAKSVITRLLLPYVTKIGSASFRRRIVEMIPMTTVQELRRISDTLHERSVRIYKEKKEALEKGDEALKHQIGEGRDIMSILRECTEHAYVLGMTS